MSTVPPKAWIPSPLPVTALWIIVNPPAEPAKTAIPWTPPLIVNDLIVMSPAISAVPAGSPASVGLRPLPCRVTTFSTALKLPTQVPSMRSVSPGLAASIAAWRSAPAPQSTTVVVAAATGAARIDRATSADVKARLTSRPLEMEIIAILLPVFSPGCLIMRPP